MNETNCALERGSRNHSLKTNVVLLSSVQICRCCVVACDVDPKQQPQLDSLNDYILYHYTLITVINLLKHSGN